MERPIQAASSVGCDNARARPSVRGRAGRLFRLVLGSGPGEKFLCESVGAVCDESIALATGYRFFGGLIRPGVPMAEPANIARCFVSLAIGAVDAKVFVFAATDPYRHIQGHLRQTFRAGLDSVEAFPAARIFFSYNEPHSYTSLTYFSDGMAVAVGANDLRLGPAYRSTIPIYYRFGWSARGSFWRFPFVLRADRRIITTVFPLSRHSGEVEVG